MFNLVIWSYGIFLISGDKSYIKPKKLFINPGIIGLLIGMAIFVFSVPIPKIVYSPINYLAAIYTPSSKNSVFFNTQNFSSLANRLPFGADKRALRV